MKSKNGPGVTAAALIEALAIAEGRSPTWYARSMGFRIDQLSSSSTTLSNLGLLYRTGTRSATRWHLTELGRKVALSGVDLVEFFRHAIPRLRLGKPYYLEDIVARLGRATMSEVSNGDENENEPNSGDLVSEDNPGLPPEPAHHAHPEVHPNDDPEPVQMSVPSPAPIASDDTELTAMLVDQLLDNLGIRRDLPTIHRLSYACGLTFIQRPQ